MTSTIPNELRHCLDETIPPEARVSPWSLWHDPIWRFANMTGGSHRSTTEFDFRLVLLDETTELQEERLTDPRFARLLGEVRLFVRSLMTDSRGAGGHAKANSLRGMQVTVQLFLRWMVSCGYDRFGSIPTSAIDGSFLDHLIREKVGEEDERSLTTNSLSNFIAIPIKLHQQGPAMPAGSRLEGDVPFGGKSAFYMAEANCRKIAQSIPALPMGIFLPVMAEAMAWASVKAMDVKRVHDIYMNAREKEETGASPAARQQSATRILCTMEFCHMPGEHAPWRKPITDATISRRRTWGGGNVAVGALQQLRRLMLEARDACVCLIQGLVGLRISEVCSLKAEPFDELTGFPACVLAEQTLNGVYEALYIRGRIYKGEDTWVNVRWAAGLRPRGSDVVPPAIQAIFALYHLYKPYRDIAGRDELVLGFSCSKDLPRSGTHIVPAQSSSLRNGQKWWVSSACGIPESVRITTHMWRKTYALQLYRADPGLLPAISLHFKHLDTQTTYEGYVRGVDPDLTYMVDEVSMSRDAELFLDFRHGRAQAGGRFYEGLMDGMRTHAGFFQDMEPQAEAEAIREELHRSRVRSHECGWGRCLYRPEWARCGGGRVGPDEANRSPSTCSGCANMLVLPEHRPFWVARRESNLRLLNEHEAGGDESAAAVPRDRVAQCDRMLQAFDDTAEGGLQ